MQKEIEIKYGEKECVLVFRDEDGNKGLFIEDAAGDPFAFIRSNSENFEKFRLNAKPCGILDFAHTTHGLNP